MKRILKKESAEFVEKVCKILEDMGAKRTEALYNWITYELDTIAGRLTIRVDDDNVYCYSVFAKFDEPARAREMFDCNRFTGKYNLHITNETPLEVVLDDVELHFESTLKTEDYQALNT